MLSIFVMYSNDREVAFLQMQEFLKQMPLFDKAQKTLVVDGRLHRYYEGWGVVEVPRINGKFCWGRMWDAGVMSSVNEFVVYLDSDRLLPKEYLTKIADNIVDNKFLFTSNHYQMYKPLSVDLCNEFLKKQDCFSDPNFVGVVRYEPRLKDPYHGPSKNVMSGSTAFTKKTYFSIGGVDHWYCGHGAYADTDFHYQASKAGCKFIDLGVPELHWPHTKNDNEGKIIDYDNLKMMSLDNFIYYCIKWRLSLALAENVAVKSKIKDPKRYVADKSKLLRKQYEKLLAGQSN